MARRRVTLRQEEGDPSEFISKGTGWCIRAGQTLSLPKALDTKIRAAMESGLLCAPATKDGAKNGPTDASSNESPTLSQEDADKLRTIIRDAISMCDGDEEKTKEILTASGKPKVEFLEECAINVGVHPDLITGKVRDELYFEVVNSVPDEQE